MKEDKYIAKIMKIKEEIRHAVEDEKLTTPQEISEFTGHHIRRVRSMMKALNPNLLPKTTKPHIFWTLNVGTKLSDNLHVGLQNFARKIRKQQLDKGARVTSRSTIANAAREAIKRFEITGKPTVILTIKNEDIILQDTINEHDKDYKKLYAELQNKKIQKKA